MLFLKNSLFLILGLILSINLSAQEVTWMPKNKLAKKDEFTGLAIFGINNGNLAIANDKNIGILDANTLELKELNKKSPSSYSIINLDGKWISFTDDAPKLKMAKRLCIYYKFFQDKSAKEKELICIDMYKEKKEKKLLRQEALKNGVLKLNDFIPSQNNQWVVLPIINYLDKTIDHYVFNTKLELIYEKKIPYLQKIKNKEVNLNHATFVVTNEGDLRYGGYHEESQDYNFVPFTLEYKRKTDEISNFIFSGTTNRVFNPSIKKKASVFSFGPVRRHGSIIQKIAGDEFIYAGTYKDSDGKNEKGIFFGRFNFRTNTFNDFQEIPFSQKMLTDIPTKKNGKLKGNISLKDMLVKADKDIMLLFELNNTKIGLKTSPTTFQSGLSGQTTFETRWEVDIDNRDILYYNFNSQNELTYSGNIKKHQKKGKGSDSFLATTIDNKTYILFNSLSSRESELMKYTINQDGSISEKEVLRSAKKYISPTNQPYIGFDLGNNGLPHLIINKNEILINALDGKRATLVKVKL